MSTNKCTNKIFNKFNVLITVSTILAFIVLGQFWYMSSLYAKQNSAIAVTEQSNEMHKQPDLLDYYDNKLASNHFQEIRKIKEHMDKLFDDSFSRLQMNNNFEDEFNIFGNKKAINSLNLKNDSGFFTVTMQLPKAHQNNVNVKLDGQRLTVSGDVNEQVENSDKNMKQIKQFSSRFTKSIILPEQVKENSLTTEIKDNILTIKILKASVV